MKVFSVNSYFINPHAIPLLIIGLLILSSGLFVFTRLKDKLAASTFLVMSISGSIWFFGTVMGYLSKYPENGLFWFKIDNVGVVFLSSTVYAFVVSFLGLFKERKPFIFIAYIGSTILAILTLTTNLMDTGVQLFFWGFFPRWGPLSLIFLPFFCAYMLFSFLELIFYLKIGSNGAIKNQIIYFIVALGFAYTSSIDYFATFGIPVYPTSFISMGAYFIIIAFAITKARLMDISVIISKSIAYVSALLILMIFYLAFVIPYRVVITDRIDVGFISITIAFGVFVAFSFEKLRINIQTSSDKLFLKGKYDFTDTIAYFSDKLSYVTGMEDLNTVLEEARVEKMELKMLGVRQKNDLTEKEKEYFLKLKKPVAFSELPTELKNTEKSPAIEYVVPCLFKGGLIALLYVGKKLSEDPFSDEEIDALKVIAPQIAIVIERIKPYERVKVDLAAEQEKVKIAQKAAEDNARLAALGTLAAGLAHEIRNPMAVLRSKSETVLERIDDKEYVSNYARMMPEQIDRILSIINRMLKFAKAKSEEMETTDVNKVIEDTLSMLDGRIKDKGVKTAKSLAAKTRIMANPVMLSEAFFNIMQNSLDFMEKDGVLRAKSSDTENGIEVEIEDTGAGMTKEQVEHIFEPFFTTRAEGTGLGLSISHRNILDHKGRIQVSSQVGKGTSFKITFQAA